MLQRMARSPLRLHGLKCTLIALALFTSPLTLAAPTPAIVIACPIPPDHASIAPVRYAFTSALKTMNLEVQFYLTPPLRAYRELFNQQADMICLTSMLGRQNIADNNGLVLGITLAKSDVVAWALRKDIHLTRDILSTNSGDRVGYIENQAAQFYLKSIEFNSGTVVTSFPMAAKMMLAGRLDIMVTIDNIVAENTISYWIEKHKDQNDFEMRSIPLYAATFSPVLHKKHHALAPQLKFELQKIIDHNGGPISRSTIAQWLASAEQAGFK